MRQVISTTTSNATAAAFRAWGLAHSNALAAAGMVKTSDTGQIDWATVAQPGAANTKAGYEIWRFNDSLQSSAPIFLKFEYGTGTRAAQTTDAAIWVTIGTATNGAGTLTGTTLSLGMLGSPSNAIAGSATPSSSYICNPSGTLTFVQNERGYTGSVGGAVLVVDRIRDSSGNPTANGAYVVFNTVGVYVRAATLNFVTPNVYGPISVAALHPGDLTAMAQGATLFAMRHFAFMPAPVAAVGAMSYLNAEVSALTTFMAIPVGSTPRGYLALGSSNSTNAAMDGSASGSTTNGAVLNEAIATLAVLWED